VVERRKFSSLADYCKDNCFNLGAIPYCAVKIVGFG